MNYSPTGNVIQFPIANAKGQPKRSRAASAFDLYPLPFFDRTAPMKNKAPWTDKRWWSVKGSGNYSEDCERGREYAQAFLQSCDGTVGWSTLLSSIVIGMIGDHRRSLKHKGLVVGFTSEISRALVQSDPSYSA